jgi:hypothetical protein
MRNAALQQLEGLVGDWQLSMANAWFLETPEIEDAGSATISWLGDAFLEVRATLGSDQGNWNWMIGRNDSREALVLLYHDERGVGRVFEMTFAGGQWTLLREDPDFHQRFVATVEPDRIVGRWEASEDFGKTWRTDFDLIFKRRGSVVPETGRAR